MQKFLSLTKNSILILLLLILPLNAQPSGKGIVNIEEEDGSPSLYPYKLKVTNNALTDNSDGTASINLAGHDAVTVTDTTTVNLTLAGQLIQADGLYTAGDDLTLTGADFDVDATVTRDTEWDTLAEINTASTDADILIFQNIAVSGQTTVATDAVADTLTLAGAGITAITTDATTDTITFTSTEVDGSTTNELPTAGTAIDVTGQQVDWDSTEVEATTWGAGGNASNIWSFNVSGTDHTMTIGSGLMTFSGAVTSGGTITSSGTFDATGAVAMTIGSADITGLTITTDGTGNGELTLPNDSIGDADIDWGTGAGQVSPADVANEDIGDITVTGGVWAVENDSHDHSAAGSTVTINAADITDKNAGTDITADLEEEVTEGSLADSTIVSADIKDATIAGGDLATNIAITTTGLITANGNLTVGNGATTAGVLTLNEDTDDGANYASFQVPALAANTVYTLPADDGDANEVLSTNGTGTLDWVAAGSGANTALSNISSTNLGAALNVTSGDLTIQTTTSGDIYLNPATNVGIKQAAPDGLLEIEQAANATALSIDNNGTGFGVIQTQDAVLATNNNAYYLYSNSAHTNNNTDLLKIEQDNASSTAGCLKLMNDGTGVTFYITNTNTSDSIQDDSGAKLTAAGVWTDAASTLSEKTQILPYTPISNIDKLKNLNLYTYKKKRELYGGKKYIFGNKKIKKLDDDKLPTKYIEGEQYELDRDEYRNVIGRDYDETQILNPNAPTYIGYVLDDISTPDELKSKDAVTGEINGISPTQNTIFLMSVCKELIAKIEQLELEIKKLKGE